MTRYRKKPVEVEAVRWTYYNADELAEFAGNYFSVTDEEDREYTDDPEATASILDRLHSTWILVQTGDWIVRGPRGEFYPVRNDVFEETYEEVQ